MERYDKNTILNQPELLNSNITLGIFDFDVEYFINHANDGRVKGLFKFNNRIIHGISVDTESIISEFDSGYDIIKNKLRDMVYSASICQYCGDETNFDEENKIYSCHVCNASSGIHKEGKNRSLGSVAKEELHAERKRVHYYFDKLWKYRFERGIIEHPQRGNDDESARNWKTKCRIGAYRWLGVKLGIDEKYCHIGMFNNKQCEEALDYVIKYSEEPDVYYNEVRNMIINGVIKFKKYDYSLNNSKEIVN